jgi:thioredoxin-like negative regulator of GroEL
LSETPTPTQADIEEALARSAYDDARRQAAYFEQQFNDATGDTLPIPVREALVYGLLRTNTVSEILTLSTQTMADLENRIESLETAVSRLIQLADPGTYDDIEAALEAAGDDVDIALQILNGDAGEA